MPPRPSSSASLRKILADLERAYGREPAPPATDPYELVVFVNCGYPASDTACAAGYAALEESIGIAPAGILTASDAALARALRRGGIFPEQRAGRLREIAARVRDDHGGDLRAHLAGPVPQAKKVLMRFPTIGEPGADRVLLYSRIAPIAVPPSNCLHVPIRLGIGEEAKSYAATYRSVQAALEAALPKSFEARIRAHRLLKLHGAETCKRSRPRCDTCSVFGACPYGRSLPA